MDQFISVRDDIKRESLEKFIIDIDCLGQLSQWLNEVNIFDILRVTKSEIRHSNILAWLLDPNESHGLFSRFLNGFVRALIKSNESFRKDVLKLLMMDFQSFSVRREWKNIDLLVISEKERCLICIENKIESCEHNDQLERYKRIIEEEFNGYMTILVFLTPNGDESSDSTIWKSIDYKTITSLLEQVLDDSSISTDSKFIIKHYMNAIKKEIIDDKAIIEICNEIYARHRMALDLIFENRMDSYKQNFQIIKKWCEEKAKSGLIFYDSKYSNKSYIRFSTKSLEEIFPLLKNNSVSGWNCDHSAFYEINNRDTIGVMLSISAKNLESLSRARAKEIYKRFRKSRASNFDENWSWKRLINFITKKIECDDLNTVEPQITGVLERALAKIQEFEKNYKSNSSGTLS